MNANVKDMTTAELVAEYNALTGKSIKKFSTRAAGERQVEAARSMDATKSLFTGTAAKSSKKAAVPKAAVPKASAPKASAPKAVEPKKDYHPDDGCPKCGEKEDQTYAGLEGTAAAERLFCHRCGTEYHQDGRIYVAPAKSVTRSENIKASWSNKKIAKARATRHHVIVNWKEGNVHHKAEFRSVREAFQKFRLPESKHIKFRAELKQAGRLPFGDYKFNIVEA